MSYTSHIQTLQCTLTSWVTVFLRKFQTWLVCWSFHHKVYITSGEFMFIESLLLFLFNLVLFWHLNFQRENQLVIISHGSQNIVSSSVPFLFLFPSCFILYLSYSSLTLSSSSWNGISLTFYNWRGLGSRLSF